MAKRYALLLSILVICYQVVAQGVVTLTDHNGMVVNGTVILYAADASSVRDTIELDAILTGNASTEVNMRRHELWVVENSRNFYCWAICLTSTSAGTHPTWVMPVPMAMEPGTSYNNFHAYYEPQGQVGYSRFRYVWYDTADPNGADSSWVDIDFGSSVGIGENSRTVSVSLQSWPNPSMGDDITIAHTLNMITPNTEMVIYTVVGERIHVTAIRNTSGKTIIPKATLRPGVYFANLEQNGQILATHRIVVAD